MKSKYWILYLPYVLSVLAGDQTDAGYWVAWLGSWFIIVVSLSGFVKPLPENKPWHQQFLRPFVLPQLIYAGFTALTSVFYYLHVSTDPFAKAGEWSLCIQAQQYYALGHAALVHALLWRSNPGKVQFRVKDGKPVSLMLVTCLFFVVGSFVFRFIPGFSQFLAKFQDAALVASTLLLALSIPEKSFRGLLFAGTLFAYSMYQALLSGFKEAVIVPLIMLAAFLYPRYRSAVTVFAVPAVLVIVFVLPTYVSVIRKLAWEGEVSQTDAAKVALAAVSTADAETLEKSNEEFLLYRISEVSMFNKFMRTVPENVPFYNFKIINQSLLNLLPRVLYPSKPITELVVMERVRENKIIEFYSTSVSAKPPFLVDGYLSFGGFGVWLFCFAMGLASAFAMQECERLFGGYLWGTCLMYTGLFQIFWRGNCLEFMVNTVFWSFVLMYLLFYLGRQTGWIVPAPKP